MARIVSKFQFRSMFTIEEKAAMTEAAKTDSIVEVFMYDLSIADEVDLDDLSVAQGLGYATQIGLLTSERVTEILSSPISETPPAYSVTIKAMDVITPQNVSGAVQRTDGKWSVKAEFFNSINQQYNLEMEFNGCPTQEEINTRIEQEARILQRMN